MNTTITVPQNEYYQMKEEIQLLKNTELLSKINRLIDILYQEKFGLVLTDETNDLTEIAINNLPEWKIENSGWDNV